MEIKPNHKIYHYRADIDGLRALAIIFVLFYHIFPNVIKGGFVGVDVFFVISGFLITGIILNDLKNDSFSFVKFYSRRIIRILPVLVVVIALSFIAGWFLLLPKEFMELGKHIVGGVGFVANFTLWNDAGYFDVLPELKPLLHLWSLGVEEQFYLLWPLMLFIVWKIFPVWISHLKLMTYFVASALLLSFVSNIALVTTKPDLVFYFPFTRFWEIFTGAALCIFLIQHPPSGFAKRKTDLLSIFGLVLILIAVVELNKNSLFPGWWAILPTIGTACVIAAGHDAWLNKIVFSNNALVGIGLISYPLYLWHWPILSFVYMKVGSLPYGVDKIAVLVSSFFLALLSYKLVETPIRHIHSKKLVVSSLLGLSIALGALGIAVYKLGGVPSRIAKSVEDKEMPIELQEMLNPDFGGYISKEWREHKCFLAKGEDAEQYGNECIERNQKPLVFLWGDSHAAALYSGLKAFQKKKKFAIAQYTASACPPVINWDGNINKLCREINNHNISLIRQMKPEIVILQAAWYWSEYDWKKVAETINELKKIGISRIILTGPVPNWKEKVPYTIISYYRNFKKLPASHTTFGVDINEISKIDRQLEEFSREHNVTFISIYQTLCNSEGCMLSIGNDIRKVSSLDYGHLSVSASEFVIESVAGKIFENSNQP